MDLFSAIRHLCLLYGSGLDRPQIVYVVRNDKSVFQLGLVHFR